MNKACAYCHKQLDRDNPRAKFCNNVCKLAKSNKQQAWRYKNTNEAKLKKLKLVNLFGGGCKLCNYSKNLAALAFHHKEPTLKSFTLGMDSINNRSWEAILAEANKCELLCHNCHSEYHYPKYNKELVGAEGNDPSSGH